MKEKANFKNILKSGIFTENPILGTALGLCPLLAVSTKVDNAIGMSMAVFIVLLLSNITISLIRKITPNEIRIPVFIIVIATFVSSVDQLMEAFTPEVHASLGIFIPLIVVNCIILGRAEAFASKNKVLPSIVDAVGTSIGYAIVMLVFSFARELLATQTITLSNPFNATQSVTLTLLTGLKISLFGQAAGAFLALGVMFAIVAAVKDHRTNKKKKEEAK